MHDIMQKIDLKTFTVRRKYEVRARRQQNKDKKWGDDYEAHKELLADTDIQMMREPYTREFYQRFSMAFRNYIAGQWIVAREMLHITQNMLLSRNVGNQNSHIIEDAPSTTLLTYMKRFNFEAPESWDGCRALTSK